MFAVQYYVDAHAQHLQLLDSYALPLLLYVVPGNILQPCQRTWQLRGQNSF